MRLYQCTKRRRDGGPCGYFLFWSDVPRGFIRLRCRRCGNVSTIPLGGYQRTSQEVAADAA